MQLRLFAATFVDSRNVPPRSADLVFDPLLVCKVQRDWFVGVPTAVLPGSVERDFVMVAGRELRFERNFHHQLAQLPARLPTNIILSQSAAVRNCQFVMLGDVPYEEPFQSLGSVCCQTVTNRRPLQGAIIVRQHSRRMAPRTSVAMSALAKSEGGGEPGRVRLSGDRRLRKRGAPSLRLRRARLQCSHGASHSPVLDRSLSKIRRELVTVSMDA